MLIFHDPQCADYGSSMRPEQPSRVTRTAAHLRATHPAWEFRVPPPAASVADATLQLVHTPAHLRRVAQPRDFDADTPFFENIADHARRSVSSALAAARHALAHRTPVFSLMRPPGHHATAGQAMGFCYLNQIAVAAVAAAHDFPAGSASLSSAPDPRAPHAPIRRVAIWDFDAHHGNGTESIVHSLLTSASSAAARDAFFFASVHQHPGYPGTGTQDLGPLLRNWPVAPRTPRGQHMAALRASLDAVLAFRPDLILVSAGFDAYARDPITSMTLEREDFATLGRWLAAASAPSAPAVQRIPTAALLEGGYSEDLPLLVEAFLAAWE